MQKSYLIKNLFFASNFVISCYAMDTASSYLQILNESTTNSFQLLLKKDIDLSGYSENLLDEIERINCQTWQKERDPIKKRIYGLFVLLKKANANFPIKSQKRTSMHVIETDLAQSGIYDDIVNIYKKISAVDEVINNSDDGSDELNSTLDSENSSFTTLQG